jgi:hypothetical protein
MCSSLRLPTKAAVLLPAFMATLKTVGTRMKPRSGRHEFQLSPWSATSNPDSIAACEGSVEA